MVEQEVLTEEEIMTRHDRGGTAKDFFEHYDLGTIMGAENDIVYQLIQDVREEPDPPTDSIFDNIYPPFPDVQEPIAGERTTNITYGGAIQAALSHIIADKGGVLWGEDVANLGGVMQATAGLAARHPERVLGFSSQ